MSKYATVDFSSPPLGPEIARISNYVSTLPFPNGVDGAEVSQRVISQYVISRSGEFLKVRHEKELCLFLLGKHPVYEIGHAGVHGAAVDAGELGWLRVMFEDAQDTVMGFVSPFANVEGVSEFVQAMFGKYKKHRLELAKRTSANLHPFLTLEELRDNIRDFGTPYPIRDLPENPVRDGSSGFVTWLLDPDTTYLPERGVAQQDGQGVYFRDEDPVPHPDFDFYT